MAKKLITEPKAKTYATNRMLYLSDSRSDGYFSGHTSLSPHTLARERRHLSHER